MIFEIWVVILLGNLGFGEGLEPVQEDVLVVREEEQDIGPLPTLNMDNTLNKTDYIYSFTIKFVVWFTSKSVAVHE